MEADTLACAGDLRAVAPFLILVARFAVFLQYHGYGFLRAEVAAILFIMAAMALVAGAAAVIAPAVEGVLLAGLLTLFVDLQFDPPKGSIGSVFTFLVLNTVLWFLRGHAVRRGDPDDGDGARIGAAAAAILGGGSHGGGPGIDQSSNLWQRHASPHPPSHPRRAHRIRGDAPRPDTPAFEREVRSFYDRHGFRSLRGPIASTGIPTGGADVLNLLRAATCRRSSLRGRARSGS